MIEDILGYAAEGLGAILKAAAFAIGIPILILASPILIPLCCIGWVVVNGRYSGNSLDNDASLGG